MKFVTACALLVSGAAAFAPQAPQKTSSALNSFSYLGNMSNNMGLTERAMATPQGVGLDTAIPTGGAGGSISRATGAGDMQLARDIWDTLSPTIVQGGSLRTWVTSPMTERVQVLMKSDGRPLNANVELWAGPDNTPQKTAVYIEDGNLRPFSCVIETPRSNNAIAIRNTGHIEFPLNACVEPDRESIEGTGSGLLEVCERLGDMSIPKIVQGGAIHTIPFSTSVQSVQILLKTDGRPLNSRIELLQGPNNNKQVIEVYTEDGLERPFFAIIETPGTGNVVRIVNTATMEFPITASVEPYLVEPGNDGYVRSMNEGYESQSSFFFLDN